VYGKNNMFKGLLKDGTEYEHIKIAILDSGIAYTEESDRDKLDTLMDAQDRVAGYQDFIDRKDEDDHTEAINDQVGHGTRVAYQLLKTTLTARVYIARVVKKVGKQWLTDEAAVAKAIIFAAKSEKDGGWGVDIINMSFGWSGIDDDIRTAIGFARSQDVLMFASTSNFGITKAVDILYPASAPEVISVDAADGLGNPLALNPKSDADTEKTRFTAPGEGIASPISTVLDKGTSFASPIAAGVAALILEFASQTPLNISKDILEKLKQQEGMVAILRLMTKEKTTEKFRFLVPWLLLQGGVTKHGGDGGPLTQRSFVARLIVNKLRIVFKKPVGVATFPIEKD
jgi:subtilisin family serine protease